MSKLVVIIFICLCKPFNVSACSKCEGCPGAREDDPCAQGGGQDTQVSWSVWRWFRSPKESSHRVLKIFEFVSLSYSLAPIWKSILHRFDMFVVSIDERNETLSTTLKSQEPIHYSVDGENGRFETAKLFPHLNILVDNHFEDDLYRRDLIVEKFLSRPKFKLEVI